MPHSIPLPALAHVLMHSPPRPSVYEPVSLEWRNLWQYLEGRLPEGDPLLAPIQAFQAALAALATLPNDASLSPDYRETLLAAPDALFAPLHARLHAEGKHPFLTKQVKDAGQAVEGLAHIYRVSQGRTPAPSVIPGKSETAILARAEAVSGLDESAIRRVAASLASAEVTP
ncbi:MAG: hypothetical protein J0L97_10875 [Alphaproteobacteria bacterium]|nr:hypothetical protein [Alphaproteobacteria bacterium]